MAWSSALSTRAPATTSEEARSSLLAITGAITIREAAPGSTSTDAIRRYRMVCPFCVEAGVAAANYELAELVKHIAKRHPVEGLVVSIIGTVLIAWGGPKLIRNLTA